MVLPVTEPVAGRMWDLRSQIYKGNSGSRRPLRRADVAEADVVDRTKLQRIEAACLESCRITI